MCTSVRLPPALWRVPSPPPTSPRGSPLLPLQPACCAIPLTSSLPYAHTWALPRRVPRRAHAGAELRLAASALLAAALLAWPAWQRDDCPSTQGPACCHHHSVCRPAAAVSMLAGGTQTHGRQLLGCWLIRPAREAASPHFAPCDWDLRVCVWRACPPSGPAVLAAGLFVERHEANRRMWAGRMGSGAGHVLGSAAPGLALG